MEIKIWKGPSHLNKLLMIGWVIAGFIGILIGIYFRDRGVILLSIGIIVVGAIIYGIQMLAWKKWEEQQEKQGKSARIFPSIEKFFKKKKKGDNSSI